jgi:hypothetical protein
MRRRALWQAVALAGTFSLLLALASALPARAQGHASDWSTWTFLGGPAPGRPAVASNADGRLEVFFRGSDNALWHIWQTGGLNPPWSGGERLGTLALSGNPAVARNRDGRLEVFVRGPDNALWHIWQTGGTNPAWSGWESLGGAILGDPAVAVNADGRMEVFVRGTDRAVYHRWQTRPSGGPWGGYGLLGGILLDDPVVVPNADGRLEVFGCGADQALWHTWQASPSSGPWIGWLSLGAPPGRVIVDHAIGRNGDGRLEAFVRTSDGMLYYKWQTHLEIDVVTERHQLGGWVTITGKNATPGGQLKVQFEGSPWPVGAYSGGWTAVKADGTFTHVWDARCGPAGTGEVTVRAIDATTGRSATGRTNAFSCPPP